MAVSLFTIGTITIASLVGAFGAVYLKKGSKNFSFNFKKLINNYVLIFGVFCYGVSTILYMVALKGEDLSVVYPLVSLTYIFISVLSIKMLGERMNTWRWLGVIIIIAGIIVIGLGG